MSQPVGYSYLTSPAVVSTEIRDEYGNVVISGEVDGNITGNALTDFLGRNVWNGTFSYGPATGTGVDVAEDNVQRRMPYFNGPTQVVGGSFHAQWIADATSASGYVYRLFLDAGSDTADDGYIEYWTQIASSRTRSYAYMAMLAAGNPSASNSFQLYQSTQFFKVDGTTTTGTSDENTVLLSAVTTPYDLAIVATDAANGDLPAPSDAWWLRVRIGLRRNGVAVTTAATVDLYETRVVRGTSEILLPDRFTSTNRFGIIKAEAGVLTIRGPWSASNAQSIQLIDSTGVITLAPLTAAGVSGKPLFLTEQSAPSTPASGVYYIYPGTDSTLRFLNDAGVALIGASQIAFPATQVASADPNTLDDYEKGSFTPGFQFSGTDATSWTYSVQQGAYTKLGNCVFFTVRCQVSTWTKGAATGNFQVTGLPFTPSATIAPPGNAAAILTGYTKANFTTPVFAVQTTTVANINVSGSGQTIANLAVADFTTLTVIEVRAGGVYFV